MEQRSTFVTVVGWIFIVFSGLFLLESLMFMFLPFDKLVPKMPPPQGAPAPDPALMSTMMHGAFFVLGALSAWVLLSSIGLVLRKNWARISFMVIMVINLIFTGLYLIFGLFAVAFMPSGDLPGQPPEIAGFMRSMMVFMVIFCAVFGGLYGWILYVLTREKIKREFLPAAPGQG